MSFDFAQQICSLLQSKGEAYLVGGFVRDQLLAGSNFRTIKNPDLDVATNLKPDDVLEVLLKHGVHAIFDEAKNFGVVRVRNGSKEIEIATFRSDGAYVDGRHPQNVHFVTSLEQDARRRDFTCNAIYYNPVTDALVDPTGGVPDIKNKILRTVGDPSARFQEDYLRMIRYCRFRAKLGFKFSRDIRDIIRNNAKSILQISPERIRMEFDKAFLSSGINHFIADLERTGLLQYLLPEISELKSVDHPPEYHLEGGVYRHTLCAMRAMSSEKYKANVRRLFPLSAERVFESWEEELVSVGGVELPWAILLHDIGKKPARGEKKGKIHFIDHQYDSRNMSRSIMERFRFSNREKETILWLVENHLKPQYIPVMRVSKRRAFLREPLILPLLLLFLADVLANYGATLDLFNQATELYLHEPQGEEKQTIDKELKHLTDGKWLMEAFHLKPGKIIAKLKKTIEERWLEGSIRTREDVEQQFNALLAEAERVE